MYEYKRVDICRTELSVTLPHNRNGLVVGLLLTRAAAESLLCAVPGDSASRNYALLRFVFHSAGGTNTEEASERESERIRNVSNRRLANGRSDKLCNVQSSRNTIRGKYAKREQR